MSKKNLECGCDCCNDEDVEVMSITLDDGTEIECAILGVFDVDDKEYIALLPMNEEDVLIYEYKEIEDEIELKLIEDEDEFDRVSDVFDSLYDDELE